MTPILAHGLSNYRNAEYGYVLLRGLIIMFIITLCFAGLANAITAYAHRGMILFEQILQEIQERNSLVQTSL
jgi:hypothetical protein